MAQKLAFLLLLLTVAMVAGTPSSVWPDEAAVGHWGAGEGGLDLPHTCNGHVGECAGEEEEMMMESEISRRGLLAAARAKRFISYGALLKDRVPCNSRGHSYYNCQKHGRANPYRRGCTMITRCARILH